MRHLAPHSEPVELTSARPSLQSDWAQIPRTVKQAIRDRLYRHQLGLCGYCEGSLGVLGRHIEHIEPKGGIGGNPTRTFEYSNLIASCQGDTEKPIRAGQDASCGHFKDQLIRSKGAFSLGDFISPREAGCEQKFKYLSDGRIIPAAQPGKPDHLRAQYTIKVAGLDCHRLRNRRRQIAGKLIRQIARLKNDAVQLQSLANHYLGTHHDSHGAAVLRSFYSTRKQRFLP
jgi:uncharacterized protein (TIGR02646 family)